MKLSTTIILLVLFLAVVIVLSIVNHFYPLRQSFSDSGALIQLATSSPAYFPVWVQTDDAGNYVYPQVYPSGYPWLTNIPTRDPLYRYPYLAGVYGDWSYYNYPFAYHEVVDMNKVKASEERKI